MEDRIAELEKRVAEQADLLRIQSMTMASILNWIFQNREAWKWIQVQPPDDVIGLLKHIMRGEQG